MKVFNKHHGDAPEGAVNIMRGTKWGNPYIIGEHGDRKRVIRRHKLKMMADNKLAEDAQKELAGKDLVCCCSPSPCHGDTLLEIAETGYSEMPPLVDNFVATLCRELGCEIVEIKS